MFKEWEDFVLAATVIATVVVIGKKAKETYDEIQTIKAEDYSKWMKFAGERLDHVSKKLDYHNASPSTRVEAYTHARELMVKYIEFYETNTVCRTAAIDYCNDLCNRYIDIWK